MSHYWTADDPPELRHAQAEDWLEDLGEFEVEIVESACREWRRQPGGKRPTPGDLRFLCIREQTDRQERARPALPTPDQAERALVAEERRLRYRMMQLDGREYVNRWARERGHADLDTYAAATGVHWSTVYLRIINEIMAGSPLAAATRSATSALAEIDYGDRGSG